MASQANIALQALQTNELLNQLPPHERNQIQQAVGDYRQTLLNQGYTHEVVQNYVWQYYAQCVTSLYQKNKDGADSQQAAQPAGQDVTATAAATVAAAAVVQQGQVQQLEDGAGQRQQLLQQQQQLLQQQLLFQQQQQQQGAQAQNRQAQTDDAQQNLQQQVQQRQLLQQQLLLQQQQNRQAGLLGAASGLAMGGLGTASGTTTPAAMSQAGGFQGVGGFNAAAVQALNSQQQDQSQHEGLADASGVGAAAGADGMQGFMTQTAMGQQLGQGGNAYLGTPLAGPGQTSAKSAGFSGWHRPKMGGPAPPGPVVNPAGGPVSFQLRRPPAPPGLRGTTKGGGGLGMNQMQQEHRLMQLHGKAPDPWGGKGAVRPAGLVQSGQTGVVVRPPNLSGGIPTVMNNQTAPAAFRGPTPYGGVRGPGLVANTVPGAGTTVPPPASAMGARPQGGLQFPPSMRKWLQRLFQTVGHNAGDSDLQQYTHKYLRHWVQQWVKTGEFRKRNWDQVPLPSADEIRANLPPGSLACKAGGAAMPCGASACAAGAPGACGGCPSPIGAPTNWAVRPGMNNWGQTIPSGASNLGFDNRPRVVPPPPPNRSRSRDRDTRRSRSRKRRNRRSPSSSRSRSRSKNRDSSQSSRQQSRSRDRGQQKGEAWSCWKSAKGKGKTQDNEPKGPDGKRLTPEELKQKVVAFLEERLQAADWRGRQKDLQEELMRSLNIGHKRFRNIFQQSLGQYLHTYYGGKPQLTAGPKQVSQGEQEMRAQRAARFQSHLQVERATVAMISFNDGEGANVNGGPIIGELNQMCSREEAREREQTRQLDKLEWRIGTDAKHPEVNPDLATKKYQRSSADKAYRSQDVRTLDACRRTMEFLMSEILDLDRSPKPKFAVQTVPYIEVYSYLRDRTRSVRVDLHLQQPRSTTQRTFVETHECCLRLEMLSMFILSGGSGGSTEKYDQKLGLKAISQTIEPLLNAYQAVRDKQVARSILEAMGDFLGGDGEEAEEEKEFCSPYEPAVHRYIVLLLMAFSPEELQSHLAKLSKEILSHPLVSFATQAWAAFRTDDYSRFLRCYRQTDFLTAVAMSGVADLARLRALWLLMRSYPQPVGDKLSLSRIKNVLAFATDEHARSFLAFHGVTVVDGESGAAVILPKKGTPEAEKNTLLAGGPRLPDKCEYPKGADSLLEAKLQELGLSRAAIVFGGADPVAAPAAGDAGEAAAGEVAAQDTACHQAAGAADGAGEAAASEPAAQDVMCE